MLIHLRIQNIGLRSIYAYLFSSDLLDNMDRLVDYNYVHIHVYPIHLFGFKFLLVARKTIFYLVKFRLVELHAQKENSLIMP